jgi:hypothetical protein
LDTVAVDLPGIECSWSRAHIHEHLLACWALQHSVGAILQFASAVASSRIAMLPALLESMAVPPVVARLPFTLVFPSSMSDVEPAASAMAPPLPSTVLFSMVLLWMLTSTLV